MALAYSHVMFLFELRKHNILPADVRLMEFGEQNWYGDISPMDAIPEAAKQWKSPEEVERLKQELEPMRQAIFHPSDPVARDRALFQCAKIYYSVLFNTTQHDAVDLHGSALAKKYDLNFPLPIEEKYNMVLNFGTGEHVFNQYQYFKNMHDLCEVGGLMLHSMPNQGCYDHGFYNYHPTFIFDLAAANQYEISAMIYADLTQKPASLTVIDRARYVEMAIAKQLSSYSALLACLKKTSDAGFVIPQQAYYDNKLPPQLHEAWKQFER